MIKEGEKYLITTDAYFVAPDGEEYRAVWGTCHIRTAEVVFGFTPQRPSTNWFLEVGRKGREVMLAGCQIHYAVRCNKRPKVKEGNHDMPNSSSDKTPLNKIYLSQ